MFDCLSWYTDDDAEGVARPVVTGWLVHVDLIRAWVYHWI